MDEEKKITQNSTGTESKESVENQLNSFINPTEKPGVSNITSEGNTTDEPLIKFPDVPEPPKQNRPIIRTYKSDVEETIQTSHISSVNIAMAENRKMMSQGKVMSIAEKSSKLNKNILIISSALVLAGTLIFIIPQLIVKFQNKTPSLPLEIVSSKPIMTVDLQERVNINDINLNRVSTTLKERVDQSATQLGQIKNIYLTDGTGVAEKLITASKFLELIGATIPNEIQRTLKDSYMFGLYNYNGNQRFVILKVGSFDTTFSGMLSWETTLWQDFKELFNLQTDVVVSDNPFAIEVKKFQDATFNNKDCRIVKDSSGNIIFLYSIIDDNTIVITTSPNTLKEIISRTGKARIVTQ